MGMFEKITKLYKKYQEPIKYLVVGGIGTVISLVLFTILFEATGSNTEIAQGVSWVVVVLLMYVLNRYIVFEKHAKGAKAVFREFMAFISARIMTFFVEYAVVKVGIDILGLFPAAVKLFAQVLVIILNYVMSKLFIFKHADETGGDLNNIGKSCRNRKTGDVIKKPRKRR